MSEEITQSQYEEIVNASKPKDPVTEADIEALEEFDDTIPEADPTEVVLTEAEKEALKKAGMEKALEKYEESLGESKEEEKKASDDSSEESKKVETKPESEEKKSEEKEEEKKEEEKKEEKKEEPIDLKALKVKINGEETTLSIDDIVKDHPEVIKRLTTEVGGEKVIHQKMTALDKERKEWYKEKQSFEEEKKAIEDYIAQSREKLGNGNIEDSIKVFAELGDVPFHRYKAQLLQWALPQLLEQQEMSESEIEAKLLQEENRYLKEREEAKNKQSAEEQSKAELQKQIDDALVSHKIDKSEWDKAVELLQKDKTVESFTVSDVIEMVGDYRAALKTAKVVDAVKELPEASQDTLFKIALENPSFTQQDLESIAREGLEKSVKKDTLSKEDTKTLSTKASTKESEDTRSELQKAIDSMTPYEG